MVEGFGPTAVFPFGTVVVKRVGHEFDGQVVYGRALHELVRGFHEELVASSTFGTAIADFREAKLNGRVSTELMAAKLGPTADQLPNLVHLPTFGNSEVHAPLQIAGLICSAIVWPIAAHQFCDELTGSPLLNPAADEATWRRFRQRLQEMIPPTDLKQEAAPLPQEIGGHRAIPLGRLLQKRAATVD